MSGTEGARHFLQVPSIVNKSMEYHYPAEFIVPTNVPFDVGPIGKAYETEFEQPEGDVGLHLDQMLDGVLVVGGTAHERFLTNFQLVYEAAIGEANYLIITTNKEWRRMLDLNPDSAVFRLGEDLFINPIDPEGLKASEHATNVAQAFAQAFNLSRLGFERLLELLHTNLITSSPVPPFSGEEEKGETDKKIETTTRDLLDFKGILSDKLKGDRSPVRKELDTVSQFLQNMTHSALGLAFGTTMIPFHQLIDGVTILEIDLKVRDQIQFLVLCLLAKIMAYGQHHPDQRCLVLIDLANVLVPLNPTYYKSRETEPYLLDWLRRFRQHSIGIHLSLQVPSRFPSIVLNSFHLILAHKIAAWEDLKVISNLLHFLPDRLVHSRERRNNYQEEYLKTLPPTQFILKRPDIASAFPVEIRPLNFDERTHVWTSEEIQERLRVQYSNWKLPERQHRDVLELDFGKDVPTILKIISILQEYPEVGKQGILSFLNSDPAIDLEMLKLDSYLHLLVENNYIAPFERGGNGRHVHTSYELTEKGKIIYNDHLRKIREGIQRITESNNN